MPIDAIAVIHVSPASLSAWGEAEVDAGLHTYDTGNGSVVVAPLEDAFCLHLGLRFDDDPKALGVRIRSLLGELADDHGDERGVYVYPDVARSSATTYETFLEDMGEGGNFVRMATADEAAKAKTLSAGDAMGIFDAVQGMMGGDLMSQMQAALSDPSGDGMKSLAGIASQLLQNDDLRKSVQSAAEKMMGEGGLAGLPVSGDLLEQAKSLAGQVAEDNPELVEQLSERIESEKDSDSASEAEADE